MVHGRLAESVLLGCLRSEVFDLSFVQADHNRSAFGVRESNEIGGKVLGSDPDGLPLVPLILRDGGECGRSLMWR